jgi:6-phosphogluconolactonase (cycloisomerase 2 family)
MTFLSKLRRVENQLRIICFAITGFLMVLLLGGFLIQGVNAQSYLPISVVYTQSNIPANNQNSVVGFQRDGTGKLTPLPTSPFPTQGSGIANLPISLNPFVPTTFLSDQEVIVNPERTKLFAVNSGSSTIAVFDIKKDGSLIPVEGSPFPSNGVEPVSLGLADKFLYVVNQNLDPSNPSQEASGSLPNYTAFRITPRGQLIPVPNSTVSVPSGSVPTQALISPDENLLFGADVGSGLLRSFQILRNGRLLASPKSPQALPTSEFLPGSLPPAPLGLQTHPQQPILYVGFINVNRLGVYSYDKGTGELTFLKSVPNSGINLCWLITNRDGTRLYTTNSGDSSISVYDIEQDPTTPIEIQKVTLSGPGGGAQLALDSTESFLHVVSQPITVGTTEGNGLYVFKVNPQNGTLNEESSSFFPVLSADNSFPKGVFAN